MRRRIHRRVRESHLDDAVTIDVDARRRRVLWRQRRGGHAYLHIVDDLAHTYVGRGEPRHTERSGIFVMRRTRRGYLYRNVTGSANHGGAIVTTKQNQLIVHRRQRRRRRRVSERTSNVARRRQRRDRRSGNLN